MRASKPLASSSSRRAPAPAALGPGSSSTSGSGRPAPSTPRAIARATCAAPRARRSGPRRQQGGGLHRGRGVCGVMIGHPSSMATKKGEAIVDRDLRARGARQQPEQALLPGGRAHQARPRATTTSSASEAVVRHLRERPTVHEALGGRRRGRAVLPEARARDRAPEWLETATVTFPSGRHARELVPNDAAHLVWGVEPRRDRLEPLAGAARGPRPPRRAARRPRPRPGVAFSRGARRRAGRARGARASTACAASPRPPARAASTSTCASSPSTDFTEVRRAALALAREVERRMPGRATSRWWKEEREGVFIDYNQNARDRTVASRLLGARGARRARVLPAGVGGGRRRRARGAARSSTVPARLRERGDPLGRHRRAPRLARRRCSSWPRATSARASATRPGRRTSASRRASPARAAKPRAGAEARRRRRTSSS